MCEIGCVKMSRKGQSSRPPSSRNAGRQKSHRLTSTAASVRPPSVFNKNAPLPPIGTSAPTEASLSPGSNSSASVPLGLSATPAAETCSTTLSPNAENARVSALANSITVTPNSDESNVLAACSHQTQHHERVQTDTSVAETDSKHGSRYNSASAVSQQRAGSPNLTANAIGDGPLSQISGLPVKPSKRQSGAKAASSAAVALTGAKPECSSSSTKVMSKEVIVDLPLVSSGSGRLKVTNVACQCDEMSSDVKSCENITQANASAAGANDDSSSTIHPLLSKTKNTDWRSNELVSASSILGLSPSPTRRLRSGASSRTARKFHGLNSHEIQTVSTVLNSLARSQSRAAGSDAAGAPCPAASTIAAEPRVPTTERLRLAVSYNDVILLAFCVNSA